MITGSGVDIRENITIPANVTNPSPDAGVRKRSRSARLNKILLIFVRFWGVFTAVVIGGVGVDLVYHAHNFGYYEIGGAFFILILELLWVVTAFLHICIRENHCIWRWWSKVLWVEGWRKSLLYIPIATLPLLWPHKLWLSYVASCQLLCLAVMHALLSLRRYYRKKMKRQLINRDIDSMESKFNEIAESGTGGLPEPIAGSSVSIADSLISHDTILEI